MRKKTHQLRLQSIGEILYAAFKRRGMGARIQKMQY